MEQEYYIYIVKEIFTEKVLYTGSCEILRNRINAHYRESIININKKEYNLKKSKIFREYGWDNIYFTELEKVIVKDKKEKLLIEGIYQKEYNPIGNKQLAGSFTNNPDYHKEYRIRFKDRIKNVKKIYAEENKEHIAEFNKQWRLDNKEELRKKKKAYEEKNKEIISQKGKETCICECGFEGRKKDLNRHKKSQRHKKYIDSK